MVTEVKKTIHIMVDDIKASPDEMMIQAALNRPGDLGNRVFDERGDALVAAAGLGLPEETYRVWTVHMHFIRDCAFEPKQTELEELPNE